MDERNITCAVDILQAKCIVETLRTVYKNIDNYVVLIDASEVVNKSGFETLASDIETACRSFESVVGYWTDKISLIKPVEPKVEEKPQANEEDTPQTTKEWLN